MTNITVNFNVTILNDNFKNFNAILHLLSKVGKELVIEVEENSLTLRALNDSKSAFASAELSIDFFSKFDWTGVSWSGKLSFKPVLQALKNARSITQISLRSEHDDTEHHVIFELRNSNGVIRTHKFLYQDCDVISALFDEESSNYLQSEPKVFSQLLEHLHQCPEIIVTTSPDLFKIKSLHSGNAGETKRHLSTGLSIDANEFDMYEFRGHETAEFVFCSKEVISSLSPQYLC